jgi:hypothetical protein
MSDSTPSPLDRREPATADVVPKASAAVQLRQRLRFTTADASPVTSAPASAASRFVLQPSSCLTTSPDAKLLQL